MLIRQSCQRSTIAPIELGARNSDSSRLSNNRRLMKHHEAFVACSDRREVALDVGDLTLVVNDWM